jgi:predicted nucleotidyltransferase
VDGSSCKGNFSAESDVDVGVLYNPNCLPEWEKHSRDYLELSDKLRREVDLVTLNQASPILRYQVLKSEKRVLCHNQRAANEFFLRRLNEYFDLKR